MKFLVLTSMILAVVAADDSRPTANQVTDQITDQATTKLLVAPSGKKYLYIQSETSKKDARKACLEKGARLADLILDTDYGYLAQEVDGGAWINTFNGKILGPMALWSGGAISTARRDQILQGTLCEVFERV